MSVQVIQSSYSMLVFALVSGKKERAAKRLFRTAHAHAGAPFSLAVVSQRPRALALSIEGTWATVEQLTVLPGVGAKLAGRIVEYRQKSNGFKSAQELLNVRGIGEKNFAKLQPFLSVSGERSEAKADAAAHNPPKGAAH